MGAFFIIYEKYTLSLSIQLSTKGVLGLSPTLTRQKDPIQPVRACRGVFSLLHITHCV